MRLHANTSARSAPVIKRQFCPPSHLREWLRAPPPGVQHDRMRAVESTESTSQLLEAVLVP